MHPGSTLQDTIGQILIDAADKRDFVVPTTTLAMDQDQNLTWGNEYATPTQHAHGQIADYLGIPRKFYERVRTEAPDLIAINVNRLMGIQATD